MRRPEDCNPARKCCFVDRPDAGAARSDTSAPSDRVVCRFEADCAAGACTAKLVDDYLSCQRELLSAFDEREREDERAVRLGRLVGTNGQVIVDLSNVADAARGLLCEATR